MNDEQKFKIVGDAIKHLSKKQPEDSYPGKTYADAVASAWWLQEEFGGEAKDYLDYPNLVDSSHFKTYSEAEEVYESIFTLYVKFYVFVDMHPLYGEFECDGNNYEDRTDLKELRAKLREKYQLEDE